MVTFEFFLHVVSLKVLLEAIVVCKMLVADFAIASHFMLFLFVAFKSGISCEDSSAFLIRTDELMISRGEL